MSIRQQQVRAAKARCLKRFSQAAQSSAVTTLAAPLRVMLQSEKQQARGAQRGVRCENTSVRVR
jgi:hypothetical protein